MGRICTSWTTKWTIWLVLLCGVVNYAAILTEVESSSEFPDTVIEVTDPSDHCPRGRCKDGRCPRADNERCPEDGCLLFYRRCGDTLLCVHEIYEHCPGECNEHFPKKCPDGSCIADFDNCCGALEKECDGGQCVKIYSRCPEDPCPHYKPLRCDNVCLYTTSKCDGRTDCKNGWDERNCGLLSKRGSSWLLVSVLAIVVFTILLGAYLRYRCRRNRGSDWKSCWSSPSQPPPTESLPYTAVGSDNVAPTTVIPGYSMTPSTANPLPRIPLPSEPPPSYNFVMGNQSTYLPTLESPPPYSSLDHSNAK